MSGPASARRRAGGRPAVFLDRDGTLVRDVCHGADPAAIDLLPGAGLALRAWRAAGYLLVVVTNQGGIARGLFTFDEERDMERRLRALLQPWGVRLDGYRACPHHPRGVVPALALACGCRKPAPGLLLDAARTLGIDIGRSWVVGDSLSDVGAARAAGCRAVQIVTGAPDFSRRPDDPSPPAADLYARNVAHAAVIVLSVDGHVEEAVTPEPAPARWETGEWRRTGEPSAWPDAAGLAAAEEDARALRALWERARPEVLP